MFFDSLFYCCKMLIIPLLFSFLLFACGAGDNGNGGNNRAPVVTIVTPGNNTVFTEGDNISFVGSANDSEDGALNASSLQWSSSIDNQLGAGASISAGLSVGAHTITLTARDSENAAGRATVSIVVNPAIAFGITSPVNGAVFDTTQTVEFIGITPNTGSVSSIEWRSNIDGIIGTALTFSAKLTQGAHSISFTVTDSVGASTTQTLTITVNLSVLEVGRLENNVLPQGVKLVGNLAYVADKYAGLKIVDVADPASPVVLSSLSFPGGGNRVAISGQTAYVAGGTGIKIINISDSNQPVLLGSYDFMRRVFANDVEVVADRAFVAALAKFIVLDVSNTAAPTELVSIDYANEDIRDIEIEGDLAFIASAQTGLRILDISNPASPSEVAKVNLGSITYDVEVIGSTAYVANATDGVQIIDISDPTAPIITAVVDTPDNASDVEVLGNTLFVADLNTGVLMYDITDPLNPVELDRLDTGAASEIEIATNIVYVVDGFTGLRSVSFAFNRLTDIGGVDVPSNFPVVDADSNYAYVGDTNMGLRIIDISDPTAPVESGRISFGSPIPQSLGFGARSLDIVGSTVYFVSPFGVKIVDVSNSAAPRKVASITANFSEDIEVDGNIAYLADGFKLRVLNIVNPAAAVEIGSFDLPGSAMVVKKIDNLVYLGYSPNFTLATLSGGILIIDATDPTKPNLVGRFELLSSLDNAAPVEDIKILGSTLYVSSATAGFIAIDISDPSSPVEIDRLSSLLVSTLTKFTIRDDKAYISGGALNIIDLSIPSNMRKLPDSIFIGGSWGVVSRNGYLYAADRESGLRILQ